MIGYDKIEEYWLETVVIYDCQIKDGPGDNYKSIGNLKYGDIVHTSGKSNEWIKCITDNGEKRLTLEKAQGGDIMDNKEYSLALMPAIGERIAGPPQTCAGQLYTVQATDTLFNIARRFGITGQQLPTVNGAVQLADRVIVRATFTRPVSRAFFLLEPTGTETCELTRLIGVDCPSAVTGVAEILWQVPPGTLGRVFVVACIDSICAKSDEVLVIRNN